MSRQISQREWDRQTREMDDIYALTQTMRAALAWMKRNRGTNIGPGCSFTDATMKALAKRGLTQDTGRYFELTEAGRKVAG